MSGRGLWIWEEDECRTLLRVLAEYNMGKTRVERITQSRIAHEMRVGQSTVNAYFRGKKALTIQVVEAVFKLTGIPVGRLSSRLADDIRLRDDPQSEHDSKRDLQGIASDLKWSAVELMRIAERLSLSGNEADAQALLKMCTMLHSDEDRLAGYAEEVKAGRIVRGKDEPA